MSSISFDDIVGLEPDLPRRRRLVQQILGIPLAHSDERPVVPSGLAAFQHLPPPEPRTATRARMAAEIVRAVAATGCVTRDDLLAAGFTTAEIAELFTEARRISGVERMVA